jgi:multimeric flavodoxin WrbA
MPSTVALFASSRRHGNTGRLMDRIAGELRIEVIDLAQCNLTAYDYDHRNRDDEFEALIHRVVEFEQIIFASPVYWYAVSPPMKVFLDRLSDLLDLPDLLATGRRLRGKAGFVLCSSLDSDPSPVFVSSWQETFAYLGMRYGGLLHADCTGGYAPERYEGDVAAFLRQLRGQQA